MKKINKVIIILLIILMFATIINQTFNYTIAENNTAEIVMEINSNRVLHQKNAKDKKFMASTTKILTAITIIENCDVNEIVTVTEKSVGVEGSSIYLVPGEKLSVKDLLYGLMLRSGNDCAETLAIHCSDSIKEFADLMNKTAKRIGANDSNFVNPHGLHDDNHYTTAYDLALISCYAMKNEIFREIVGKKSVIIPHTMRDYSRKLINKNKLLLNVEGATGIKTGYTKKAGRCLVGSVIRNGMELISVVLNCQPMFERTAELFNNCFNRYKNYTIVESDNIIGFIKNKNSNEKYPLVIKNDVILPLTNDEYNDIRIVYDYDEITNNPKENFEEVGLIKIYVQNKLIFEEKIYTILVLK